MYTMKKSKNNCPDVTLVERNKIKTTWPAGQILPTFAPLAEQIDAINGDGQDGAYLSMVAVLAGVINKTQPRILLYTTEGNDEQWYEIAGVNYTIESFDDVVLKYKDEISGLIVWDTNVPSTINLATTIAGFENALIVNEEQLAIFVGDLALPIIQDLRGQFNDIIEVYTYMYDNLWPNCDKRLVAGINENDWELRELVAATNVACVWLSPGSETESEILRTFFADCVPGETWYIGWWDDEGGGIGIASEYGIPTVPSDYYYNYTIYAATLPEFDIPEVPVKPVLERKFYISFTLSEGDNLQYIQHAMKTAGQLWSSGSRGQYPINWTCSPALLDAGPAILNYYYQTATSNDFLVSGPSGLGYTYPTSWDTATSGNSALAKYAQKTDSYFRRTAFNMITVWEQIEDEQESIYAQNIRSLVGFTVQERFAGQPGQLIVDGLIPLITTDPRYDGDLERVLGIIQEAIGNWDGYSPAFMIPQVISWETSFGVPGIVSIINTLKEQYGDLVAPVRGDHLMMLYAEANATPYIVSLQAQNVTASGSDDGFPVSQIVNGSFAKNKGWQFTDPGDKWAIIDLQEVYTLSRYVVKNAGAGYYPVDLNTSDFAIQSSMNGTDWADIDVVTGNASNIVDKDVDPFDARYVRLYITGAGADNTARIQEFDLYGIRKQ